MYVRARATPEETRERIIAVADEHFRRVGYAKTAVADIAAELGMSPANIYRFFSSKGAINEAICQRMCAESEAQIEALLASPLPPPDKLRAAIIGIHDHNRTRLTEEKRIHEMVEAAMSESWEAIEAHCNRFADMLGRIVAEGVASGDFDPTLDAAHTGKTIFAACCGLFHPTMIAQCARKADPPDPNAMIDFILRALRAPAP